MSDYFLVRNGCLAAIAGPGVAICCLILILVVQRKQRWCLERVDESGCDLVSSTLGVCNDGVVGDAA